MSSTVPELKNAHTASRPSSPTEDKDKVPSLHASNNDTIVEDGHSQVEIEPRSKGVIEMEALRERINVKYLCLLYGTFALLAYVLSLNQYTSSDILDVALSVSFEMHSLRATIGTVTAVFQAVSQPPIAKFADAFGRVNAYLGCVFLYVLGYIIVPASTNIYMYAAGNSIYILGITGLFLLQNIIISDISSLRSRYFWTIFPSIPGSINVWVSGNIVSSLFNEGASLNRWRWGYAIFTILTPVLATPIILVLWRGTRPSRVHRAELRAAKAQRKSLKTRAIETFWQLDGPGIFLCVAGFGMFLITITLANGPTSEWSDPHSIALLVLGALGIIGFGLYEKYLAPHPMIPFVLLKKRDVIGCVLIAIFHPMSGRVVNGYFYTFLIVARDETYLSAGRLTSIPSFAATVVAIIASIATRYIRRLKPVIIMGFAVQTLAYGLMIRFRQSTNSQAEVIIVQILKGFGIGMISFPTQAVIQSACAHEHLAAVTATYLIIFYLTSGIGTAIGGAIWTNIVPGKINEYFTTVANGTVLGRAAYSDPFSFALEHALGTPERAAIARAQDEAQRIIVIVGTVICALGLLVSIFVITNVRLPDTQSIEENEEEAERLAREKAARNQKVVGKL